MKKISIVLMLLPMGCASQPVMEPEVPEAPVQQPQEEKMNPCIQELHEIKSEMSDYIESRINESKKNGVIHKVDSEFEELKDRAGRAYDEFMRD